MFKKKAYFRISILLILIIAILNILAIAVKSFSKRYIEIIYSPLSDAYSKLTDQVPFPIGEGLMYLGAGLLILWAVLLVILIFKHRNHRYIKKVKIYSKFIGMTTLIMLVIYTITWSIPFRYEIELKAKNTYTLQELEILRNYIVSGINQCAENMERDENGYLVFEDTSEEEVAQTLQGMTEEFPFLAGSYPTGKAAKCSAVLDWMNIAGFTYPYTMEVTYNKYTSHLYYPSLYAHEMSHHKGYYKEDDACFVSDLSCIKSDYTYLQYSGYLDAYYYVTNAYYESLVAETDIDTAKAYYKTQPQLSTQVQADLQKNREDYQAAYNADAHPAQGLSETAKTVSEKGWDMQAEVLKENTYDGVVGLLLQYYDGILY